jgi:hypothetical protein
VPLDSHDQRRHTSDFLALMRRTVARHVSKRSGAECFAEVVEFV